MEIYSINLLSGKFYYVAISVDARNDNKYQLHWKSLAINFHPSFSTATGGEAQELHNEERREFLKRFSATLSLIFQKPSAIIQADNSASAMKSDICKPFS